MRAGPILKTSRSLHDVKSINDIVAIESEPCDANIAARSLYDLLTATAALHPERSAVTALSGDRLLEPLLSLTHSQLLVKATCAANLFAALDRGREGVVAIFCPILPEIPIVLLGAQGVGVASSISYLLNVEAIADLHVSQRASALIVPGPDRDPAVAEKVQPVLDHVPDLETVLHIGEIAPAKSTVSYARALERQRSDCLEAGATVDRSKVCALFHTGDTTDRPKLVQLTHGNHIYAAWSFAQRAESEGWIPYASLISGSVLVRGPQVFPGYVDRDHDRGVLVGDGWLATGDVGYFTEDQRLVLTGREKDVTIRGGHNIDPAAIEDVAKSFPGVQISTAVSMPDGYAGEAPMLFAAPAPGVVIDVEALKAYLAEHVLELPARPKRVAILESLPVTAVGKIFKPTLRDLAISESALFEIERIFGPSVEARVEVERDDKLRTIVTIAVGSRDEVLRAELTSELSKLPQTYLLLPAEERGSADGDH
jgi:fatty-acyl-CoA synthase